MHQQGGRVDEGFLVAEEHRLVADFYLVAISREGDQPDGRRGRGRELGLRLIADVGARGQLGLLGRQLHRKGQTGGKPTFLAVRLGVRRLIPPGSSL